MFLIVDDEPDMCWALGHILKQNGFLFKTARNGRQALSLVEKSRFRAIFLDAKLLDIDGLELARRILKVQPAVRIVLVSGYFYEDDIAVRKALAQESICSFISKPFSHNEILNAIDFLDNM